MSDWMLYPEEYRQREISQILRAVRAGESVHLIGLSGAGKSNLVGFLANRWPLVGEFEDVAFFFLDCNILPDPTVDALLQQLCLKLGVEDAPANGFQAASKWIGDFFAK